MPSTEDSRAPKFSGLAASAAVRPVPKVPTRSQYEAERNAIRSRSRSTTSRVATDCTRPADSFGMTFFQSTGETSKPYRRSRMRRVSWASTRRWFSSRGLATASWMAALVISWNTIRCTGTLGLSTCWRCHAMASPSRSSSVARKSSSDSARSDFSLLTWDFLSAFTT